MKTTLDVIWFTSLVLGCWYANEGWPQPFQISAIGRAQRTDLAAQMGITDERSGDHSRSHTKDGLKGSKVSEHAAWIEHGERAHRYCRDWKNGPGDEPAN
jgi:hypothetical protein